MGSRFLGAGVAVVVLGVGAVAAVVAAGSDGESATGSGGGTAGAGTSTAQVVRRDLVVEDETSATVEYTSTAEVAAPVAGTVTGIVDVGATIVPGIVVASIDGRPVVALVGDVPAWRELSAASEDGVDVRQLETNLVALGFDPYGEIEIDTEFDGATEAAVDRWEEALGLDADGTVADGQVVFVPGVVAVDTVAVQAGAGAADGATLVSGRILERRFDVVAEGGRGAVTSVAPEGTDVVTGTVLYRQGDRPVVAVTGDLAAVPSLDRDLSVGAAPGADVELLETVLSAGGFDAGGTLVVDDEFDDATATAVLAWWASLGVPVDPATALDDVVVPAGTVVTVPGALRVGTAAVADGADVASDRPVLRLGEVARLVNASVTLGDRDFEVGTAVEVRFPDGTVVGGLVSDVDASLSAAEDGSDEARLGVGVELQGEIPAALAGFVEIPVTVLVPGDAELGALAVPVSALVALVEGGYAVEVVVDTAEDGTPVTELVGVQPGLYADGFVSVTADGIAEGDAVVVPS